MKFITSLILAFIAIASTSAASESKAAIPIPSESFTSSIKKVYSVRDGDRLFVAYVVDWRQQEVIAVPLTRDAQNDGFVVGDSVRCLKHEVITNAESPPRIEFTILGSAKAPVVSSRAEEDRARMQSSKDEITRRRAQREAAAGK
jgi:hypothetical protein